ncbi:MAG: HU family DNA-binding protein, partial [Deltaproteobacteria bacterium]
DLSKAATEKLIDEAFSAIAGAIRKDKRFSYPGFGTFTVRSRKARTGRNPQTGATIHIKASKTVGFKPAPGLKDSL